MVTKDSGQPESTRGETGGALAGSRTRKTVLLGYSLAIGAAIAYAVAQVLTKQNIYRVESATAGVAITVLAGVIALLLMNLKNIKVDLRSQGRGVMLFVFGGIFANVGVTCLFIALQDAPVVVVSPIIAINPLVALILAHIFLQRLEKITVRIFVGALLVVLGVVFIAVAQAI